MTEDEQRAQLRALLAESPEVAKIIAGELQALGYSVTPPERVLLGEPGPAEAEPVPFVAIGAGERAPWADEPLNCPTCGMGPLPLQESTGTGSIVLRYISHCGQSWMRGGIDP